MDTLPRRDRLLLLAVLGAGVFLAGLELMITAVALPAIVIDLADWTRLREASWIINGYLLVYVVTMPLAGRLADLWGNRRLFLSALVAVHRRLAAGRARARRSSCSSAARLVQAVGGGILVPVATSAAHAPVRRRHAPPGAGRHRRADVPRHGRRAVPGRRDPRLVPPRGGAVAARDPADEPAHRHPRAGLALGVLRQRADRDPRDRHRLGRQQRLGDAAAGGPGRPRRGRSCSRCSCSARSAR